ncbi:cdkn1a interacting zinc finger protein 1a isoform X4 [Electrophorus electricus]|uniref:cdkn1a interacting zinc finger protein 1a isoform X4 n=1 Tax=Electrophorus electricus TaxID=8005 RepID=UPI0015D04F51|nr:cdkn1a interacting zinc finger protein 1a isoform X4 [Electrophorus electricus]
MFNPHHHHQQQQQQQQFHQHLRQLQQLLQQQQQAPPPPPPPPPPPQPPPTHHIPHHHGGGRSPMAVPAPAPPPARMVNLCSATQTIIAPNPMLQGALLMQQMQAGNMRSFAIGGQQFQQFFAAGSRSSILGPVPLGVAIKTPHMGFPPRHFHPHARYFNNDFQSRQPDRKRESEQRLAVGPDSQLGPSSSRDEVAVAADVSSQSSSQQTDEPAGKKPRTEGPDDSLEAEASLSTAGDVNTADCILEEDGTIAGSEAAEAGEQSRAAEVEGPEPSTKDEEQQSSSAQVDHVTTETVPEGKEDAVTSAGTRSGEGAKDEVGEASNKFYCYICNITCHNQQNFQSHMNGLAHQQRMMEIQHMSNACLVTLLPRVQESLQGARKDGERRPGLQRWCATCQTHFTTNVMDHRKTKEHKICSRSASPSCTVCRVQFRTSKEFMEHMQCAEHKQLVEQLWKETGKESLEDLSSDLYTVGMDGEGMNSEEEEDQADEENGQPRQEGLPVQMEVTLEDMTEDEEFDPDTVYGSSFVIPVAGFLCRLCNQFYHFEKSALHTHCKTLQHFENLKRYKTLKLQEDSSLQASEELACGSSTDLHTEDANLTAQKSPSSSSSSGPDVNNSGPAPVSSSEKATDQGSLITTTATTATSITSSTTSSDLPSASQQPASPEPPGKPTDKEEVMVAEEPLNEVDDIPDVPSVPDFTEVPSGVVEEKTGRGRGRTPGKKRGRGGRRR